LATVETELPPARLNIAGVTLVPSHPPRDNI